MPEKITSDELLKKLYAQPPHMRAEAVWVMSLDTLAQVQELPEANGEVVRQTGQLYGKPIRIDQDAVGVELRQPPDRPKRITGRKLLEALGDAGIIKVGDYVRRVVIDASIDDAVRVYVERIGDERLLNVALTLAGVEISGVPAAVEAGEGHAAALA